MVVSKGQTAGYGKLLDAWTPPPAAGDPVGCVATSFTFSPTFFEEECLARFLKLESDPTEDGPVYLIEREEKLAQLQCAIALVDQHHCKGSRSLRWDLLAARVRQGVMHAKVSLLQWTDRIRLIVASANLTEDGYRRNREIFGVLDYYAGCEAPLHCLEKFLQFLQRQGNTSTGSDGVAPPALERWRDFVNRALEVGQTWARQSKGGNVYAVLSEPATVSVPAQLETLWPGRRPPTDAAVVSPFFDWEEERNRPAEALWPLLRKRGEAEVSFYVTTELVPGDESLFVHAPESLAQAQPTGRPGVRTKFYRIPDQPTRPLHTKAIWLENERWVLYLIGSSNFTSPGLGLAPYRNIEANLVYVVDADADASGVETLSSAFPQGEEIEPERIRWRPRTDIDEDAALEEVALPQAFGSAAYDWDEARGGRIMLTFGDGTPPEWQVADETDYTPVFSAEEWVKRGAPHEVVLPWKLDKPPSGFWVDWRDAPGRAWWPVNVVSSRALPPPEELKNLPLDVLIAILTSARPLHRAIQGYLTRKSRPPGTGRNEPVVNPHDKVDTSRFLLQRTRRMSWALHALRERVERPVPTHDSLAWRLRGPVGVVAVVEALLREARSEQETAFLLSELALELARAEPEDSPGCLPSQSVRAELRGLVNQLRERVAAVRLPKGGLQRYIDTVFNTLG